MDKLPGGNVREIVKGKYYKITLYLPLRKRKTHDFHGTKKAADEYLLAWRLEYGKPKKFLPTEQPLQDYLLRWVDTVAKPDLEPSTHEAYKWYIEKHINPIMGHIPMGLLGVMHVQDFYTGKLEHGRLDGNGGLSVRSVGYIHSILHEALEKAIDLELIERNPCARVKPPKDKRHKEEKIRFLTSHDLQTFLKAAQGHPDYALLYVAAYTGARQSELLALTWADINKKKNTIRINKALSVLKGKEFEIGRTKNASSNRVLDVTKDVMTVLAAHELALPNTKPENLVFPNPRTGSYHDRRNVSSRFTNLAQKLGADITFHGLRHTHATILLSDGVYPVDVAARLGHASVDTTLKIYGHLMPDHSQQTAKKFQEIMAKAKV